MTQPASAQTAAALARPAGLPGIVADWSSDQRAFKNVSWGKAMMWIFLLSDTFVFSCFLLSYMTVRMSTTVPWPNPSEVFALTIGGTSIPLILIAIMTFVLISSSGTMAMAVNFGYRRDRVRCAIFMRADRALRRHLRRDAGVRVDQADHGGGPALGKPVGRAAVRLGLLHDHRLPRHPRDHRGDLPADHRAQGARAATSTAASAASSPAARATTRPSRSWASTGTSSISSGCSSLPSSISGESGPWPKQ